MRQDDSGGDRRARETAGITTKLTLEYVRTVGGDTAVAEVLARAGRPGEEALLTDERAWHPYTTKITLFDAAAAVLDDPEVGFAIGRTILDAQVGALVRTVLWALGSPGQVLRQVSSANAKFSTDSTMRAREVGALGGVVVYRLHDGIVPHRGNCAYTRGLLSTVPALFGLPLARVDHSACQVDGAPECVFEVSWTRHRRFDRRGWRRRVDTLEAQVAATSRQLEALQLVSADLVSSADVDTVLERIATRAGDAVKAQAHLLVVRLVDDGPRHVHHDGLDDIEALAVADELERGIPGDSGSSLVADVASAHRRYGRLAAFHTEGEAFFPQEQRLLEAYARSAAAALDVATALGAAREERTTATVLLSLARGLATATTTEEVAAELAGLAPELVGADRGGVLLWDEQRDALELVAVSGTDPARAAALRGLRVPLEALPGFAGLFDGDHPPRWSADVLGHPRSRELLGDHDQLGLAVVPVVAQDRRLGAIAVSWSAGSPMLADHHLATRLSGLADQAVTALTNADLVGRMRHQALHDGLTGLPNRVLLLERLGETVARVRSGDAPAAVLFADLDGFKRINDVLGHAAGDELLVAVSRRLRACLRAEDTVARFAGDEFVALCPAVDEVAARAAARRAGATLAEPFRIGGAQVRVGASVGVALIDGVDDADEVLRRADAEMYAVKRARTRHADVPGAA